MLLTRFEAMKMATFVAIFLARYRNEDRVTKIQALPISLFRFISELQFRYYARSIAHFVDNMPYWPDGKTRVLSADITPMEHFEFIQQSGILAHLDNVSDKDSYNGKWDRAMSDGKDAAITIL